ncbi:hypothetical protein VVD49_13705 [Uliginosibacterium sp. H3]|uniref:PBP domain-containing protein n=1 Tax=Uliginosibacterium silvisoli TaxID=3114758 RepID=A0ABU6K4Z1_9RHOO|nr:hypothetical protein [Uliginosibacterium sp. H3]
MKIKFIALALAAFGAQSAFALDALVTKSIQDGTLANSHVVYLSGASALKASVPLALAKLCSDSVTAFTYASDASNVRAYSCTIKSTAALAAEGITGLDGWATHKLLLGLSVQNGSLTAILSQDTAAANQNQQVDFSSVTTAATSSVTTAFKKQTIGGFLDVNPELFSTVLAGYPSLSVSYATTPVAAGQSFGIAVSPSLYTALQTAQGITGCTNNLSPACQPSISKGQYASLIASVNAGYISDWSVLGLSDAKAVNICRRVSTSGTQAASNNYFLGKGCSFGGQDPSSLADSSAGVYNVSEGSGTGNAVTCLSDATNFAIGVLSAENASASSVWRFVKLDGVPVYDGVKARQTSIDQKYDFSYEFVYVTRNSASAVEKSLLAALGTAVSDPTITDLVGIYVAPGNVAGKVNADLPLQVAKATRGGNVCQPSLYAF